MSDGLEGTKHSHVMKLLRVALSGQPVRRAGGRAAPCSPRVAGTELRWGVTAMNAT